MPNEQKVAKIRAALAQLDSTVDAHWTDDGLPREGIVRKLASDNTLSRRDISEAQPGFQRNPAKAETPTAAPDAATQASPGEGTAVEPVKAAPEAAIDPLTGEPEGNADPAKNEGEFMSEDEVRLLLEKRVTDATQGLADAQQAVRDANKGVGDAQTALARAKEDLIREFPPMTQAQNIKAYIASEVAQRARAHGYGHGGVPGSQIDAAMQRSNSRGWRRPSRNGPVQTGAARVS